MFNDIIVPLDGSATAARALGPACALARYLDSEVRAVAFHADGNREELSVAIEEQMRGFGGVVRSLLVEPLVPPVSDRLGEILADSPGSLVCMSSMGRGRSAALLGSVASGVLQLASGPVLLVGPQYAAVSFRCHGPLLVAVDESEHSRAIIPIAESFAIVFDYDLEVVTVHDPRSAAEFERLQAGAAGGDLGLESAGAHNVASAAEHDIDAPVSYSVLHHPDPATALVEHAEQTDAALLAMSTHNPTGLKRMLAGSTTSNVVHRAPCPVLTIRPPVP